MTIKERAKHFAYEEEGRFIMRDWTLDWEVAENGYATGATEQQEIDIQRAVEWHCGECISNKAFGRCQFPNNSCEELPSLIKAIKGE